MAKPKRNIMRIDLSGEARKRFLKLSDFNGMTQVAMTSRLVEWFAAQDRGVQNTIMQSGGKAADAELARTIFKKLAGE